MAGDECVRKSLGILNVISRSPENFLDVHKKNAECLKETTKQLYDLTFKKLPVKKAVSELIVDSFENEQVWEELELYNSAVISEFITDLSHLIAGKERISFKTSKSLLDKSDDDDDDVDDDSNGDDEASDDAEEKDVEEETLDENSEDKEGDDDDDDDDDEEEEEESDKELEKIKSNLKKYEQLSGSNKQLESDNGSDSEGDPNDLASEFQKDVSDVEDSKDSKPPKKEDEGKQKKKKSKTKSSVVDDNFFKLSEMETFLNQQDALEARKTKRGDVTKDEDEEDDIDVFQDIGSDEEENVKDLKFKDFFRGPTETLNEKKVKFADDDDYQNSDDENKGENESEEGEDISEIIGGQGNKSTFEIRQERLKNKITKLEKASVSEKPWQLKGEIGATARPENSLLEEHVQFDSTLKLPPEITEESTKTIEDLIIQRIKDQAWDDVERKSKTAVTPFEYKKAVVLDQEKSKLSLGEIYEKEFLKQQQPETDDKEKAADPLHEEIDKMMNSLFLKLDALSNFHFTPKLPISEVKIVSNLPSITMEEVAPVSVSDLQLAAPKELLEPLRTTLKGKSEFSDADKKRQRKMKKKLYKLKQKEKEKQQKATESSNPSSEKTAKAVALRKLEKQSKGSKRITILKTKDKKKVSSSAEFFSRLQNEVRSNDISSKHPAKKQKVSHKSAISLKL